MKKLFCLFISLLWCSSVFAGTITLKWHTVPYGDCSYSAYNNCSFPAFAGYADGNGDLTMTYQIQYIPSPLYMSATCTNGQSTTCSSQGTTVDGGTYEHYGCGRQVTTYYKCTYHLCYTNPATSGGPARFSLWLGGTQMDFDWTQIYTNLNWNPNIGVGSKTVSVMPGTAFCYDYTLDLGTNNLDCPVMQLVDVDGVLAPVQDAGTKHSQTTVNDGSHRTGASNVATGGTGSTDDPYRNAASTNSAGGGPATSGDINRLGDNLLRGMGKLADILKGKAEEATLEGATNILGQIKQSLSNLGFTNNPSAAEIAATNILTGMSNQAALLTQMARTNVAMWDVMTNHSSFITNILSGPSRTNWMAPDEQDKWVTAASRWVSSTNKSWSVAYGAADTAIGGAGATMQGKIDQVPSGVVDEGDTGTEFDITVHSGIPGQDFRIQPTAGPWANLWPLMKKMWTWILFAGYTIKILHEAFAVYKVMIQNPGGGVPNLILEGLGTGGNIAGMALAPVFISVILFGWGIMCGVVWTGMTGQIEWSFMMNKLGTDPTSGLLTGMPRHWLLATFPWATAIALTLAYITYRLTIWKVCLLTNAAMRFIYAR